MIYLYIPNHLRENLLYKQLTNLKTYWLQSVINPDVLK